MFCSKSDIGSLIFKNILAIVIGLGIGCSGVTDSDDDPKTDDTEDQECNPDGTCGPGLTCFNFPPQRCVRETPSTYVKGRVINSQTAAPVSHCVVKTNPTSQQVLTDENGNYSIYKNITDSIIGKEIQVIVECQGYRSGGATITVQTGANQAADITVLEEGSCLLQLSTQELSINSGSSDFISLERIGCKDSINWEARVTDAWINTEPNQGMITDKPQTIKVSANGGNMASREYHGKINITTTIGEVYNINVTMTK